MLPLWDVMGDVGATKGGEDGDQVFHGEFVLAAHVDASKQGEVSGGHGGFLRKVGRFQVRDQDLKAERDVCSDFQHRRK